MLAQKQIKVIAVVIQIPILIVRVIPLVVIQVQQYLTPNQQLIVTVTALHSLRS